MWWLEYVSAVILQIAPNKDQYKARTLDIGQTRFITRDTDMFATKLGCRSYLFSGGRASWRPFSWVHKFAERGRDAVRHSARLRRKLLHLAVLAALASPSMVTLAQDAVWNGGTGNWDNTTQWSTGQIPSSTTDVQVDGGKTGVDSVVNVNVDSAARNLTIDVGDRLVINGSWVLRPYGTSIINNGSIQFGVGSIIRIMNPSGVTLSGSGTLNMGNNTTVNRIVGNSSNYRLTNALGHTIEGAGNIGASGMALTNAGLIDANLNSATMQVLPSSFGAINTGIMQASNGGTLALGGGFANTGGIIQALDGSTVSMGNTTVTGGTLATAGSGVIRAQVSTVNGVTNLGNFIVNANTQSILKGTITNNGDISIDAAGGGQTGLFVADANVTLTGTGTLTMGNSALNIIGGSVDTNRLTNAAGHTIQGAGNVGNGSMGLTNQGLILANQSTALTIDTSAAGFTNSGTVQANAGSTLNIADPFSNSGTIRANGGTVNANGGFTHGSGTVLIEGNGIVSIGADSSTTTLTHNGSNSAGLTLGNKNLTVIGDYTNANFGTGNTFNARANVVGDGQIIGENADIAITGAVTLSGPNTVTLDLGNVRGGTSTTVNYQIANTGTGADIRGAVQTAAGTGNLTDARLSGSGVTAQNFGPIAAGADSGNRSVTFTATSGGSLDGQTLGLVSNFDNVAGQTIEITGMATALAQGNATPASVDLGNFRVGYGGATQDLTVANTTTGPGAERLGIGSIDVTGNFGANNQLGSGFIDPGASQAGAVTLFVPGVLGVADANTGNVVLNYTTNGQLIDSSFGTLAANSQTVAVTATGFNVAQGATTPDPIMIVNQRVGGTESQALTVANVAPAGPFSESLNASLTANNDATSNGGAIALLAAGASNATAMRVGVDTATAGAKTGSAAIVYETDGTGTSGLGTQGAGTQVIAVSGNVYQVATPTLAETSLNLGNVRVGDTASQALSLTNTENAPTGFQESLNAGFSTTTGDATASGTLSQLTQGSSDTTSLVVGLDTASAGARSGTATLDLVSTGVGTSGLADLDLAPQTITVSGNVYQVAQPVFAQTDLNLGNVRVGETASSALTLTNTDNAPAGFQESLNASFTGVSGAATAAGSIGQLGQGVTDASSLVVGLDTSSAGALNGAATVALVSTGAGTSGLADLDLAPQTITVSGNVYQVAAGQLNTVPLNFGTVQVGQSVSQTLSISNIASGPAGFVEDLNASFGASSGQGAAQIFGTGSINGLLAGATNASNMVVNVNTGTAGAINGAIAVNYFSAGAVNGVSNGLGVLAVGSQDFGVNGLIETTGTVINAASPAIDTAQPIQLGNARVGATSPTAFVSVTNQATLDPQAALNASITGNPPITASGSFNLLDPGQTNATSLQVGMNTATAGAINGTATLAFVSDASNVGGCEPNCQMNLASQNVQVQGAVFQVAQPNVPTDVDLGNFRLGSAPMQAIGITNTNDAPAGFQESLDASVAGTSGRAAAVGGPIANLAQGDTSGSSQKTEKIVR